MQLPAGPHWACLLPNILFPTFCHLPSFLHSWLRCSAPETSSPWGAAIHRPALWCLLPPWLLTQKLCLFLLLFPFLQWLPRTLPCLSCCFLTPNKLLGFSPESISKLFYGGKKRIWKRDPVYPVSTPPWHLLIYWKRLINKWKVKKDWLKWIVHLFGEVVYGLKYPWTKERRLWRKVYVGGGVQSKYGKESKLAVQIWRMSWFSLGKLLKYVPITPES